MPGYSIPVGYGTSTASGKPTILPIGLHLLGNHWTEHILLRLGHALDSEFGKKRVFPKDFYVDTLQ